MAVEAPAGVQPPRHPGGSASAPDTETATPPKGKRALLIRLLIALVAGLMLALAFPPFGLAWLAPIAPAILIGLCRPGIRARQGALIGFVFGVGFFTLLLKWIAILGPDAWLALSAIEAAFFAILGAALTAVSRLRFWPLWSAAIWVGIEYLRAHFPLGGFPWGRVAYALDGTPFAALASLGGVSFVSFVAVFAGSLIAWAFWRVSKSGGGFSRTAKTKLAEATNAEAAGSTTPAAGESAAAKQGGFVHRYGVIAALAGALALAFGGLLVPLPSMADPTPQGKVRVGIVQGNVPGKGMEALGEARTVTKNHLEATKDLMASAPVKKDGPPDFVLWPENSTDIDPFLDSETRATVEEGVRVAGVPVLVGAILYPDDIHRQTTGIVWDPKRGPGKIYAKQHPVPFGEYIPFREQLLPYIDRLQQVGRDTKPGTTPGRMTIAGVPIGLVICFEIAYDEVVSEVSDDRSQLLVVQSNNATYSGSGQADQQFGITRLRAIEYGKATLVATPSGISGVIGPDGQVEWKSAENVRATHVVEVPKRTTRTLASYLGLIPELVLAIVGASAVGVAVAGSVRRRRKAS